jgi:hypothetical protein
MSLFTAGVALLLLGGGFIGYLFFHSGAKLAISSYRKIKAKQFFKEGVAESAKRQFYKGTFM